MRYIKQIIFSLITLSISLNAVIPNVEVWKNGENYLYLLSDAHADYEGGKNTVKQQQDILTALQKHPGSSRLIVEDANTLLKLFFQDHGSGCDINGESFTPDAFPSSLQENLEKLDWDKNQYKNVTVDGKPIYHITPLNYLDHFTKKIGVPSYNTECDTWITLYRIDNYDTEKELRHAQLCVANTIAQYVDIVRNNTKLSPYCQRFDQQITELRSKIGTIDKTTFAQEAIHIRDFLVDALILHALDKYKDATHIFIVAGAWHIEHIKGNLPLFGYQLRTTFGPSLFELDQKGLNVDEYALNNPLDLQQTFTEIFNEQKPLWQKAITYFASVWMKIR